MSNIGKGHRFVVLHHEVSSGLAGPSIDPQWAGRVDHWDMMLENDSGTLTTFEVRFPLTDSVSGVVRRLNDHRLDYLHFEGPVSGNRGFVRRVHSGTLSYQLQGAERIQCTLQGDLNCKLDLQLVTHDGKDSGNWTLKTTPNDSP